MTNATKKNDAQKIEPVVGMYIVYRNAGGNHPGVPFKITYVDSASIRGRRCGARRSTTISNGTLDKFRLATPEEIAANPVDNDGYEVVNAAVSTEAPAANHVVPMPPMAKTKPEDTPPPAANDATPGIAVLAEMVRQQAEDRDRLEKRLTEQMDRRDAQIMTFMKEVLATQRAYQPAALPVGDAATNEKTGKDAKDRRLTDEHKKLFKNLLDEFIGGKLERVDPATKEGRQRALTCGKVLEMFSNWLVENKRSDVKPYDHAIYSLLGSYGRGGHKVTTPDGHVLSPFALKNERQVEMNFNGAKGDFDRARQIDADVTEIMAFARAHLWPNHSGEYAITVAMHLDSKRFTKDDILLALNRVRHGIAGSTDQYNPTMALATECLTQLVRLAREDVKRSARVKQ